MSTSLLDQYRYTISNVKLLDPPITSGWRLTKPIFLLKIAKITGDDNELLKSVVASGKNQICWSEQTLYDPTAESNINFKVLMKKGKEGTFETIVEDTITVSGLLDMQNSSGICKVPPNQKSQLSFTVKEDRFKDMLNRAKQQSEGIYFSGGESWSTFFAYFDTVKTAADSVASLNPYAQQVWSIVSMVPNILQVHMTRNSNVTELLQQLMDIYTYINEADRLPVLKGTHGDKLRLLIDKTCECADFIKKYTENNAVKNLMRGPRFDGKISEFKKSFDEIFKTIDRLLMIEIASNTEASRLLVDMPYADNAGVYHDKTCLPGTRQKLIREILEWVDRDTSERVLILSGGAGTGKSSVAHTLAETLNNRLGSFFCFSRSDKGKVNFLFSTISRNLADRDDLWRRNLVQAIKDITIRKTFDPTKQFKEMIIKPSVGTTKPMVIIIDALDESGDKTEREILLNLLFESSSELPRNYRIIITSRPEDDIAQFHQHSNVFCKYMADVDPTDTLNDIQQVISLELFKVSKILDAVDKDWRFLLAQKAQNLFIWAKIACVYIQELKFEAAQRLRTVLSKSISSLHEMYHQILDAQQECQFGHYVELLKKCVGAVVVSRKPLSVSNLQAFFGPICGDSKDIRDVLRPLNSLFIGLDKSTANDESITNDESSANVRPIHTSLFDFFLSSEQKPGTPNRYYIDILDQSSFTHACLRVMTGMLRFNICGLKTSHLRNRDVPDFHSRVAEAIPSHLSYACCFWAYHLECSSLDSDILKKIDELMRSKLLYFFEALSLLGEVDHGRSAMHILISKIKDENSELAARAAEASEFAFEFGRMMMESTPHLYLSSLPYISNGSFISRQFLPQYPQLLSMDVGQPIPLRPEIKDSIWQRHPSAHPSAITFSLHGRQIATGFDNGDLWVWDYVTGEMISRVGPTEVTDVCNVVFSLNGELVYCCSRDGSILTWEAKTNKALCESNGGLAPEDCHDCTISPDGHYIAFWHLQNLSYYVRTLSVHAREIPTLYEREILSFYDRKSCLKLFEDSSEYPGMTEGTSLDPHTRQTHEHKHTCGMFSPSGSLFGFQRGGDKVLRLWDTQRQTFVPPFTSITKSWKLLTLSDNYIVACISDSPNALEVWDIRTRARVHRVKQESTSKGRFTISPNREYLLLSEGNKCWIWKISTREIMQRFVEHSDDEIIVTALSPDSKYIAFSMRTSRTMHVLTWDALAWKEEKDLSKDIKEREALRAPDGIPLEGYCTEARLKGQHLLWRVQGGPGFFYEKGYLRVFDTTRMAGLKLDFQVNFSNWRLVEVSPEDNHWSIAYVSRANSLSGCLCLWTIDEKEELILDRSDGEVTTLSFSATGDRLISGDSWGIFKIWHVRTRQLISRNGWGKWITALAFSPMGTTFWVAYYGKNKHVLIEERECSESQNIMSGPFVTLDSTHRSIFLFSNDAYICVCADAPPLLDVHAMDARSIDARPIVSDSCDLLLINRSTGAIIISNMPQPLKFSSNRRYIACIAEDDPKKVTLWDLGIALDVGKFLLAFDGVVTEFLFSNDSRRVGILRSGVGGIKYHVDIRDIETKGLVMQLSLSNFDSDFEQWSSGSRMALSDSHLWVGTCNMGRMWHVDVYEIMKRLYDDNLDNSESGMLHGHLQTRRLIDDYKSRSENTEVLDYALVAWNKASFSPQTKLKDGWMLGPHGELLFWIPPEMRSSLWYPCMTFTTHEKVTKLNFDKFVHGTRWTDCGKEPKP